MSDYTVNQLQQVGDNLRADNPTLWAVLRGRGSTIRIAQLLGWTENRTIRELKDNASLTQNSKGTWILNRSREQYDLHQAVRRLYQAIDKKFAEDHPDRAEVSELSTKARGLAKKNKRAQESTIPSEVQLKLLTVIYKAFGSTSFTPLALSKAQGYTQAGWSKKYLETLARKGFVTQVEDIGRSTAWQLTDSGVGYGSGGTH